MHVADLEILPQPSKQLNRLPGNLSHHYLPKNLLLGLCQWRESVKVSFSNFFVNYLFRRD
jgi:hypothetical protein